LITCSVGPVENAIPYCVPLRNAGKIDISFGDTAADSAAHQARLRRYASITIHGLIVYPGSRSIRERTDHKSGEITAK